jgi:hypothetical protein
MSRGGWIGPRARRAAVWRSNDRGCPFMPAKSVQALDRALAPQNRQAFTPKACRKDAAHLRCDGRPGDRAAARAAPCSAREFAYGGLKPISLCLPDLNALEQNTW